MFTEEQQELEKNDINEDEITAKLQGRFYKQLHRLSKFDKRCKRRCRHLVKSQFFYWLIIVLVFLNTVVLGTEFHEQPRWLRTFQGLPYSSMPPN